MEEMTSLATEPMDTTAVREKLIAEAVADGRKLVTIRQISAIDDIPGADLIKVAQVEGWKVVVKAGEFLPGDYCVFFEVDSFLPLDDPRFAFLEKNKQVWNGISGARLKTIRLRKQLSQGLALPLSMFPELQPFLHEHDLRTYNFTGQVGIMKYEKPFTGGVNAQAKGGFPSFLRKSDQERAQNMGNEIFGLGTFEFGGLLLGKDPVSDEQISLMPLDALSRACEAGRMVQLEGHYYHVKGPVLPLANYEVTLKMDGSSMTVFSVQDADGMAVQYGVCSRNLELKLDGEDGNAFVNVGREIITLLQFKDPNVALQGELMGPGIQGNREGFNEPQFFIYNIFDITTHEFMPPHERTQWIEDARNAAELMGKPDLIQHVPVLHEHVTLLELGITNMDELIAFSTGPSLVHPIREGLVYKAIDGRHQFKVINNQFLLEE